MMLCCSSTTGARFLSWIRDYDKIQNAAILLIYVQIGCALFGSLGALYSGVPIVNLVVSLFALVAIESSSQSLGRTYGFLLFCLILLDVAWFILFSHAIWNASSERDGFSIIFSVKLLLAMQIIGFSMRFLSSLLWIQIYRLGASSMDNLDISSSFLNPPAHEIDRQNSNSNEFIGGSIYDPAYYYSLFEDVEDKGHAYEGERRIVIHDDDSTSNIGASQLKSCDSRSFQAVNMDCSSREM
ncbi:hypothetical protein QJS04_geneDACA003467 [Acorus gramineus]|uniref:Uncharacterized protein n=1 Tax=Acorus gramineus TaxID=55184 RepID=A0AAV9BPK1_ACOGR|nr:hypothetical protein QJS04_geneDACA003467 [Acorus gramineus]